MEVVKSQGRKSLNRKSEMIVIILLTGT